MYIHIYVYVRIVDYSVHSYHELSFRPVPGNIWVLNYSIAHCGDCFEDLLRLGSFILMLHLCTSRPCTGRPYKLCLEQAGDHLSVQLLLQGH